MIATGPLLLSSLIAQHRAPVGVGDELARLGNLVGTVPALKILHLPIEQCGRYSGIAFAGQPITDCANMMIDAEDFLDDHDAAFCRAGRVCPVGTQLELVGRCERELLTQEDLLCLEIGRTPVLEQRAGQFLSLHSAKATGAPAYTRLVQARTPAQAARRNGGAPCGHRAW